MRFVTSSTGEVACWSFRRPDGYDDAKPVFFGHYWMTGTPTVLTPRIACVDYSAGMEGDLVAYRWYGEPALDPSRFVTSNEKREGM